MNKDINSSQGTDDPNLRANIWAFKAWFEKEPDVADKPFARRTEAKKIYGDLIGSVVAPRLGIQRLEKQIAQHNPDLSLLEVVSLTKNFKESGGQIAEMDDLNVIVKVSKGMFVIPKLYTKPAK